MSGDQTGASNWAMADVSAKAVTRRRALASGTIVLGQDAFEKLQAGSLPKGDPLAMAEVAAVLAAKQTPALIPLCHPIGLNRVLLRAVLRPDQDAVELLCLAETTAQTGVEMEALTGLTVALLTVWDLCKPGNAALRLDGIRLLYKSGGKQGVWKHPDGLPDEAKAWLAELG